MPDKPPKIAIVTDWLTNVGGAERVLLAIHEMYPDAPIYTSKYDKKGIDWFKDADVRTGWLQIFPTSFRYFLSPLRQRYFRKLKLDDYDLVISVTGAEAKGITRAKKHICYCHVPTQYYWQMYDNYVKHPGLGILSPIASFGLKLLIKPMRKRDYAAAQCPDKIITISHYAAEQIKKYYDRDTTIIAPPVNVAKFLGSGAKATPDGKFSAACGKLGNRETIKNEKSQPNSTERPPLKLITTSRQVAWKRIDLCIKACLETGDELTIIGQGPEHNHLEEIAHNSPLISFYPQMTQEELETFLRRSDGYLFPSLEPFGIAPVEALAAGCPVIAYAKGGSLDYVKPGENGILFEEQTISSLADAIRLLRKSSFSREKVQNSAKPFDVSVFKQKMEKFIDENR